jgi:hypothetical protein
LIRELENLEIVTTKKNGRSKFVTLTQKGKELANLLEEFVRVLEGGKASFKRTKGKKLPEGAGERLTRYYEKLLEISEKVKNKDVQDQKSKIKRIVGRYRQIIKKMRPKDEKGRQLRRAALMEIESILRNLS